jgi:chaperonin GroES
LPTGSPALCAGAFTTRTLSPQTAPVPGARPRSTLRSHLEESTMNFHPLADRLLVRRIEEQETVRGGIIIPDTAKEKPQEGEVVAVGPGRLTDDGKRVAPEVKKGDRILVGKYSGTDVKIDGTEYTILREDEVLGVLSKTAETSKSK